MRSFRDFVLLLQASWLAGAVNLNAWFGLFFRVSWNGAIMLLLMSEVGKWIEKSSQSSRRYDHDTNKFNGGIKCS